MKKIQRGLFPSVVCGLFSTMMLPGCIGNGTAGGNEVSVDSIPMDTTVYLDEANTESPKCQIKINFKYLKSADKNDSLTQVINQVLEDAFQVHMPEQLLHGPLSRLSRKAWQVIT